MFLSLSRFGCGQGSTPRHPVGHSREREPLQRAMATSQGSIWTPALEPGAPALPTALTWHRQSRGRASHGAQHPGCVSPTPEGLCTSLTPGTILSGDTPQAAGSHAQHKQSSPKPQGRVVKTGPKSLKTLVHLISCLSFSSFQFSIEFLPSSPLLFFLSVLLNTNSCFWKMCFLEI